MEIIEYYRIYLQNVDESGDGLPEGEIIWNHDDKTGNGMPYVSEVQAMMGSESLTLQLKEKEEVIKDIKAIIGYHFSQEPFEPEPFLSEIEDVLDQQGGG